MATMHINFGSFDNWANTISTINDNLNQTLKDIQTSINGLDLTYQSNASTEIREKIIGMQTRFDQYYQVVDSYVKFIRSTGQAYKATEEINTNTASDFI